MDIVTPAEVGKHGYALMNTDDNGITGLIVPANLAPTTMKGTVRVICLDQEDIQLVADVLEVTPKAVDGGLYELTVEGYNAVEDVLHHYRGTYGIDVIAGLVQDIPEEAVQVIWD